MTKQDIAVLGKEIYNRLLTERSKKIEKIHKEAEESFNSSKLSKIGVEYDDAISSLQGYKTDHYSLLLKNTWITNYKKKHAIVQKAYNLDDILHKLKLELIMKDTSGIDIEQLIKEMMKKFG